MPKVEPFYIDRRFTRSPFGFVDIEDMVFPKSEGVNNNVPTSVKKGYENGRKRLDSLYGVEKKTDFEMTCIGCNCLFELSMFSLSEFEDEAMRNGWRLSKKWIRSATFSGYKRKKGWVCPKCLKGR